MSSSEDLQARVVELETRYTLQQDTLQKLSDVLWQQQREIDSLSARFEQLRERLSGLDAAHGEKPPANEKPPHY